MDQKKILLIAFPLEPNLNNHDTLPVIVTFHEPIVVDYGRSAFHW